MIRCMLLAIAVVAASVSTASAYEPCRRPTTYYYHSQSVTNYSYAKQGYAYRYYRGRANSAASYTQMFGI